VSHGREHDWALWDLWWVLNNNRRI
jgi:hypothetical protein